MENDYPSMIEKINYKNNLAYLESIISIINDLCVIFIHVGKSKLDDPINTRFRISTTNDEIDK